jgi:hypothetical protein
MGVNPAASVADPFFSRPRDKLALMENVEFPGHDFVYEVWQDLAWYSHYVSMMERGLIKAGDEARADFAHAMKKLGIDAEGMYDSDYNDRFNGQYPKHLRYAFTVLCGSFVENWLPTVCEELCKRNKYPVAFDSMNKNKRYESAKEFLRAVVKIEIPNRQLERVQWILQIRHCIIHAYGDVGRSRDEKNLRARARKIPGYELAGDLIWLEKEFPPYVVQSIRSLFQEIFKLAGFLVLPEDFIDDVLAEPSNRMFGDEG